MNEQITIAAELDALLMAVSECAEAAVIHAGRRPYAITEDDGGRFWAWSYWQEDDESRGPWDAETIPLPWAVLYRPDQPQRVQPSREDVLAALGAPVHAPMDTHHPQTGECLRCPWPVYEIPPEAIADAVLALFAQQPTVAEVKAEALREYAGGLELALAGADPDDFTGYEWVLTLLRNRADGIEAGR